MQGEEDARRLRALGVQPHKVRITGNLKLDQPVGLLPAEERESVLRRLDWVPQGPVWVAGSTHPGEEEILLRVFDRLRRRFPGFCLVVAPRNPRRAAEVATLAERAGWRSHRRCLAGAVPTRVDVFILDTIGELAGIYSLATFAFVGGSLVPAGGHNPIEPAQRGVPVVFGPHMSNFSDIAAILRANGAGFQVVNEAGLVDRLERWLEAPHLCCEDGERARRTVAAHQGAARRTMEAIREFL
jgi:3-deoxy-D-manno-octulosonic-acid transferase